MFEFLVASLVLTGVSKLFQISKAHASLGTRLGWREKCVNMRRVTVSMLRTIVR